MVSLWIVILTLAIVGVSLWFIFGFSSNSELRKEPYKKIPAHHSPGKKRRV
ncbi:MAG TPA: hypothetical protein VN132_13515 [Bdellovibrio sp.]|nr:hypothetical protein [Bdellovibrio sp.]